MGSLVVNMKRCDECKKNFDTDDAFEQHNKVKHSEPAPKKKTKIGMKPPLVVIVLIIIAYAAININPGSGYVPLTADGDHVKGSGSIEIVEYSDFECPACGRAFPYVKSLAESGEVKIIYKQFPLTNIHKKAFKAAEASECAADQGKFWEYHDLLFANQNALDVGSLKNYAQQLSIDSGNFTLCLDSGSMRNRVEKDMREGSSLSVSGTPTFFVNGKRYAVNVFEDLSIEKIRIFTS
jgi:protein-disulfide isomerase